ncbi:MAG: hypothetical protein K8T91_23970 [Planctomycetes bacterium]|nr:hypothetical protein [Planctomycetota bacterium]
MQGNRYEVRSPLQPLHSRSAKSVDRPFQKTSAESYVFEPTLMTGHRPILKRALGAKEYKLIYDVGGGRMTRNVPVPLDQRQQLALSDDDVLTLARWACLIEGHYSRKKGAPCPLDMEWAKDGRTGEQFIVQARPETVQSRKRLDSVESYHLRQQGRVLVRGRSVGEKIGAGMARIIHNPQQLGQLQDGEVLVTEKTDPDWEPIMKRAAAIVTNRGGRTCHAAIVSRELGLPAIVGAETATSAPASRGRPSLRKKLPALPPASKRFEFPPPSLGGSRVARSPQTGCAVAFHLFRTTYCEARARLRGSLTD